MDYKNVLIVDTETTGLDATKSHLIELAVVLYNVPQKSVVAQCSVVFPCTTNQAEKWNHIPPTITHILTKSDVDVGINMINQLATHADVVIAHNATFDQSFCAQIPALQLPSTWVCSAKNIAWPQYSLSKWPKLKELCDLYKISCDKSHRALADCHLLIQCLEKANVFCPIK